MIKNRLKSKYSTGDTNSTRRPETALKRSKQQSKIPKKQYPVSGSSLPIHKINLESESTYDDRVKEPLKFKRMLDDSEDRPYAYYIYNKPV